MIFNPTARGEKAKKFQKTLEALSGKFDLKPTHCAGAARMLAAEAVQAGYETIVAAGGDGTLNEVLNGIGDVPEGFQQVRLGVVPLGTINVFARELRVPLKFEEVLPLIDKGEEMALDIGRAEFVTPEGPQNRLFLQLAGAGLDARSVELVSWNLKKKIGPGAYLWAGLQALRDSQPRIMVSNGRQEITADLVLVGNGRLYGGEFPIFHKSDLQDGVLDAVIIDRVSWTTLPSIGWNFLLGRLFREGTTDYLQAPELQLRSEGRVALQLDGEFAGELPARLTILPRQLRVIAPRVSSKTH